MDLSLDTRTGLPDALRVLLAEHPREAWEADPNFNGLVSFWLDRHMMFRKLGTLLAQESRTMLDGGDPYRFANAAGRYGSLLLEQLHGHHHVEDTHYFPVLVTRDTRLERGFALLDSDHHALDAHMAEFADTANAALSLVTGDNADPNRAAADFMQANDRLNRVLLRHLEDEEDLIVPVILKYGTEGLG